MKNLYENPIRVYLALAFLAILGVWAGTTLPVSLFPNVSQPEVGVQFSMRGFTPDEFRNKFGSSLERGLRSLKQPGLKVEHVEVYYRDSYADYKVQFTWNSDPDQALKEVRALADTASASMPQEVRETKSVYSRGRRSKGFFLATCSSKEHTPTQIFELVEPLLKPRAAALEDGTVNIWNPNKQRIDIRLKPERMAALGIYPQDVEAAVAAAASESSGGSLRLGSTDYTLFIPKQTRSIEDVEGIQIPTAKRGVVRLTEVADVMLRKDDQQIFKTSGVTSLMIIGNLKDGGNIKRLSENLKTELQEISKQLPPSVNFQILVDPSVSIRESINHVIFEVAIGATLAVIILFLFIGSLRNVITAAIEIPLSLVLAFILMKMFGMNLNIISLGGLALSAGMNVDASVVVMENIFRKFEGVLPSSLSRSERLSRVVEAVKEVFAPILASTIASLVVFIPIVFTSDLTHAILGDLAKAVVFSHVFSAFVALLLVPTVRLHLMKLGGKGADAHKPPIEFLLLKLEAAYTFVLERIVGRAGVIVAVSVVVIAVLASMATFIVPRLPTEIVGKPDSTLVGLWAGGHSFTRIQQVEALLNDAEKTMLKEFPGACEFIYTEIHGPSGGVLLCKLESKKAMKKAKDRMEKIFKSTPENYFEVFQWDVAELPLPNPPDAKIEFSGGKVEDRARKASEFRDAILGSLPVLNVGSENALKAEQTVLMHPRWDVWRNLSSQGFNQTPNSLLAALRKYSKGEYLDGLLIGKDWLSMKMSAPGFLFADVQELRSFPIAVGEKVLPLSALFDIQTRSSIVDRRYVNGEEEFSLDVRVPDSESKSRKNLVAAVETLVANRSKSALGQDAVSVSMGDPRKEIRDAIEQLAWAAAWSLVLILITMLLQFGTLVEALLVLVAVPLALIGVMASLFVFGSTLSVNSVLGVILLNGISVANSILLVDFAKRLCAQGLSARDAVIAAASRRLRPILITSLTTILGMMPIALGLGEGGKVLQPLGIAVSGGMGISMLLTIFLVPALHGLYLSHLNKKRLAAGDWA